ncbi:mandelate racemase/muconate lactonizing enzyme family protein [Micromonospora sp. SL4-19]|uniref:mandelate racemase/muconate lactonizing enzyme family protein n=1 Tax=Micromonospora sp. SL4-19 TaxID=3399129 RepID=UPI003A4D9C0B
MNITGTTLHPVKARRHSGETSQHVIVKLHTDAGITGLGEISDLQELSYLPDLTVLSDELNRLLTGRDVVNRTEILGLIDKRYGTVEPAFRWGIEIALYDALGKLLDQPMYNLLGGRVRDRLRICYPLFPMYERSVAEASLVEVDKRLGQGFDMFRVYICGNLEVEEWFFRELRERHGDVPKIKSLDFSARFDRKTALRIADRLVDLSGTEMVESPVRRADPRALAEVRRALRVPVSEHVWSYAEALRLLDAEALDVLNISLAALGGVTAAVELFALARHTATPTLLGTTQEMSIGTAAVMHVAMATPNIDHPGDAVGPLLYLDDVTTEPVPYADGHAWAPDGPGLGVTLDEDRLAALSHPLYARD